MLYDNKKTNGIGLLLNFSRSIVSSYIYMFLHNLNNNKAIPGESRWQPILVFLYICK